MKLQFEPNLDYQIAAVEAVCDLFRGQEICRTGLEKTCIASNPPWNERQPSARPFRLYALTE